MPSPSTIPVIGALPGTLVELVPGKKFLPLPPATVEHVAVCELVPAGEGTFRPVARICPQWFSLNQENLRRLGIGISRAGMKRLIVAGFVVGQQTTPGVYQFDYFSYRAHAEKAQDPEFWDQVTSGHGHTNRQRYSAAI
jgi:hypothetical protein